MNVGKEFNVISERIVADVRIHEPLKIAGDECQTNVDDCPGQCESAYTIDCTDLVNDFMCNCHAGYTGKNCSVR